MIAPLTNDTVLWLAVIAGVTLVALVGRVASIFRPDEIDEDDLADRIETAIERATHDLLVVLEEIRDSNQAILEQLEAHARGAARPVRLDKGERDAQLIEALKRLDERDELDA